MSLLVIPRLVQLSVKRFKGISFEKVILLIKKLHLVCKEKEELKPFIISIRLFWKVVLEFARSGRFIFLYRKGRCWGWFVMSS